VAPPAAPSQSEASVARRQPVAAAGAAKRSLHEPMAPEKAAVLDPPRPPSPIGSSPAPIGKVAAPPSLAGPPAPLVSAAPAPRAAGSRVVPLTPPPAQRRPSPERPARGLHIGNLDIRVVVSPLAVPAAAPAATAAATVLPAAARVAIPAVGVAPRLARGFNAFGFSQA
jgi:hypothetical protein